MNVLVIEPDNLLGQTYQSALIQAGHKVKVCGGAQAAVQAADKRMPDVVVMEMQLLGHSGIEFLYEFRSYIEWQQIPVILHTFVHDTALEAAKSHFERLHIREYLYKPTTTLQKLVDTVNTTAVAWI